MAPDHASESAGSHPHVGATHVSAKATIARDQAWGPSDELIFDGQSILPVTVFYLAPQSQRLSYHCHPVMKRVDIERVNDELESAGSAPLYIKWADVGHPGPVSRRSKKLPKAAGVLAFLSFLPLRIFRSA